MKVKYTAGPRARLTEAGRVERDEPVEVSEELGKQLIKQDWVQVPSTPVTKQTVPAKAAPKTKE